MSLKMNVKITYRVECKPFQSVRIEQISTF